jgi:NADPH-dependent 2,4-dienoyl-CoA reductase/sulfur reductase-like enzyme
MSGPDVRYLLLPDDTADAELPGRSVILLPSPPSCGHSSSADPAVRKLRRGPIDNLSILIRSFNEEEHIGSLLAGIATRPAAGPDRARRLSASTDRTVEIARHFGVEVVEIDPRPSRSAAP